ncbi:hypothetical protein NL676_017408 [Syzygium grande]|nr:hypothetical protein NL676_017408 [Syzygium grande]
MGERPRSEMLPPRDPKICLGSILFSSVSCTSSSSYLLGDWTTHFSLPLHSLPNVTLLSQNSQQLSQSLPSPPSISTSACHSWAAPPDAGRVIGRHSRECRGQASRSGEGPLPRRERAVPTKVRAPRPGSECH